MIHHGLIFGLKPHPYSRSAGAHRIATVLREEGWDCEVIDFARLWDLDELKELVRSRVSNKTVFVSFSTFFNYWEAKFDDLISWLAKEYPNIKTIIGGQSVGLTPAKHVDYWVDSYAEVAIVALLKSLTGNSSTEVKFDARFFGNKQLIKSISAYPAYPLDSYRSQLEKRDFVKPYEWLSVEFSRGCKFKCDFCNFPILGVKGDYSRTQDDFEREMKFNYDNWGVTDYYIADETFNDRPEKIKKFADVVDEQLDFKPYFSGFIRSDLLISHTETWEDLVRLGVGGQYYGIESFNHDSAKLVGKGMKAEKLKAGLLEYKQYMQDKILFRGTISLIVGLPFETAQSMDDAKNWALDNWNDQSLMTFPLDISGEEGSDYNAGQTNLSDFTKNLLKYGIRPMKKDNVDATDAEVVHNVLAPDHLTNEPLVWEHDTMNLPEAKDISDDIAKLIHQKFKIDNWNLSAISFGKQQHINDVPDAHLFGQEHGRPDEALLQVFLKEYKSAKLSWVSH